VQERAATLQSPVTIEDDIRSRLDAVRQRIVRAARAAGRDPAGVRLVAVSKTFGPEHVRAAAAAGQIDFGENRVQEAQDKMAALADVPIAWHLVGHLQANKTRKCAGFRWIHSIDRPDLLLRLERALLEEGRTAAALVQVDLAGEATKHGATPGSVRQILDTAVECRAVQVRGLMLLPPFNEDPEATRRYFRALRALRDDLRTGWPPAMLEELSMGMSHDFEVAIAEGATMVRVGTAIFGTRAPQL
jgi:pyridoxal phosphate enzyme (YggS family)